MKKIVLSVLFVCLVGLFGFVADASAQSCDVNGWIEEQSCGFFSSANIGPNQNPYVDVSLLYDDHWASAMVFADCGQSFARVAVWSGWAFTEGGWRLYTTAALYIDSEENPTVVATHYITESGLTDTSLSDVFYPNQYTGDCSSPDGAIDWAY